MRKVLLICFALCFVFAMYAMAADDMGKSSTVKGWVADDKCLESGAKMVVVTDGDQKILMVDNPDSLKGHEGHHVAVTGTVKGDSIHVDSAKML
jgi:hypothetical protein